MYRNIIVILCLLFLSSGYTYSQDTNADQFWVDVGFGYIGNNDIDVDGYSFRFSYMHDLGLFSIRWLTGKMENSFLIPNAINLFPEHNFQEYSLLYGKALRTRISYASVSAGIGYFKLNKPIGYDKAEKVSSLIIPLNLQLFLVPTSVFAIGLDFNFNLNKVKSYYAAFLCLQIGLLR